MVDYGGAVLPITVDDSALKRSLAGTLGSFKAFGTQVDGVMANLGRFTIAATGLYALKKAFDATTGAALSFNQQLRATWAVAGDLTTGELRALGGEVRNLARQFNMTSTEAQHAFYEINQSVFYGAEALTILKESAKGAAAGMTDVYTVADMMTTVLNAYGMSAEKSAHVNDVLFQTVLYGKVTMNELATEFGRLAGVAAPVGASLEEVSAAIATLTRLGIDTDTAVTAVRQSLFQILRPSKALQTAITSLGYTTGRSMVETLGFAKSLQALVDYGNSAGIEMETLFSNIRAVLAVLPLTSTAADEYAQDLQRVGNSAGAADTAFKKVTSSWLYQIQNMKVRLNDLAISFGQMLVPAIGAFLKTLNAMLTPLAYVSEFLAQIGGQQLVALATVLGTVTLATIGLTKAWAKLAAVFAAKSIADMPLWAARIGAALSKLGGDITGLGLLKGAGLGLLGALGIGAGIKGLLDFEIMFDVKVSGLEKAKTAIMEALGPIIAGAIFGGIPGAVIGAITAGAGALTIYVIHEVRKSGVEQASLREEAIKRFRDYGVPLPAKFGTVTPWSETGASLPSGVNAAGSLQDFAAAAIDAGDSLNVFADNLGISVREARTKLIAELTSYLKNTFYQSGGMFGGTFSLNADQYSAVAEQLRLAGAGLASLSDAATGTVGPLTNIASSLGDISEPSVFGAFDAATNAIDLTTNSVSGLFDAFMLGETPTKNLTQGIAEFATTTGGLGKFFGSNASIVAARKDFQALWDELGSGSVTNERAVEIWDLLTKSADLWAERAEIARLRGLSSADAIQAFADELQALVDPQLAQTWKQQIAALVDTWKNGATMETRITAGQSLQSLGKALTELASDPAYSLFKDALLGLVATIEAAGIRIGDVANPLADSWKVLSGQFSSGQIDLDDFIAKLRDAALAHSSSKEAILYFYGKLKELSGELDEGVSAQKFFQTSLNLSESAAKELATALDAGAAAAEDFAAKIARINLSGLVAGIDSLLQQIGRSAEAATTVGEWDTILSQYEAITSYGGNYAERFERILNNQRLVEQMTQAQYDSMKSAYQDALNFPAAGKTNAELQEEANRAAKDAADKQKAASQKACDDAQQSLDEAYAAQQEAFRSMFETPITKALRGGDFVGAAKEIQSLADRFHELAAEGAPLGMSAQDVLSMIQGAKSGLESALDGLISISGKNKDLVYALEELKKQVETAFEATGSELQQAAAKVRWEDILSSPAEAGKKIRAFVEEDMRAAHEMEQELVKQMEEQIAQLQVFGYDASKYELTLDEFRGAIEGASSTLTVLRYAFKEFADELNTLITTLFPGKFGQFLTKLVSLAGSVVSANWGGKGLGNLTTPKLAEGGITTDATLAMIGEAGPEAIIPLDQLPSLMANMGWAPAGGFAGTGNAFDAAWAGGSTYGVTGFGNVGGADTTSIVAEANALAGSIGAAVATLIAAIRSARQAIEGLTAEASGVTAVPQVSTIPVITASPEELALQQQLWDKMLEVQAQIEAQRTAFPAQTNAFATEAAAIGLPAAFPQGTQYPSTGPETMAQWQPFVPAPTEGLDTGAVCDAISKAIKDAFDGLDFKIEMPARAQKEEEERVKATVLGSLQTMWSGLKGMFTKGGFGAGLETLVGGLKEFQASGGMSIVTTVVNFLAMAVSEVQAAMQKKADEAIESLTKPFVIIGKTIGQIMPLLRRIPEAFSALLAVATRLAEQFANIIRNTEQYQRIQSALSNILTEVFNALLGFLWPVVAVLEKLIGVTDEATESLNSLNVPSGYKVTRAEWKAARPGEPGVPTGSGTGELPAWVTTLLDKFSEAIASAIKPFKDFINLMADVAEALGPAILQGLLPSLEKFGKNLLALGEKIQSDLLPLLEKHLPGVISGALDFFFGAVTGVATLFVDTLINTLPNLEKFALAMEDWR